MIFCSKFSPHATDRGNELPWEHGGVYPETGDLPREATRASTQPTRAAQELHRQDRPEAWVRQVEGKMDRGVFVLRAGAENTTLAGALGRYAPEVPSRKKGRRPKSGMRPGAGGFASVATVSLPPSHPFPSSALPAMRPYRMNAKGKRSCLARPRADFTQQSPCGDGIPCRRAARQRRCADTGRPCADKRALAARAFHARKARTGGRRDARQPVHRNLTGRTRGHLPA